MLAPGALLAAALLRPAASGFLDTADAGSTTTTTSAAASYLEWRRQQVLESSGKSVAMSLVLNSCVLLGTLLLYLCLLGPPSLRRVLAPRLPADTGWRQLWRCALEAWGCHGDRHALRAQGLDGLVMLRFCLLGLRFSTAGTALACVLLPVYAFAPGDAQEFDDLNLSNLENDGTHLWVSVVAAYVLAALFLQFAAAEWARFIVLRKQHFRQLALELENGSLQAMRSLLVEFVPREQTREKGVEAVRDFFQELFPTPRVHSCVLQTDTRSVYRDPAALLRGVGRSTVEHLRHAVGREDSDVLKDAPAPPGAAPAAPEWDSVLQAPAEVPTEVPSEPSEGQRESLREGVVEFADGVAGRTLQAAQMLADLAIGRDGSETAFVTFRSVADRVVAEQLVLSHSGCWQVRAAPEARDVVWPNASVAQSSVWTRSMLAEAGLAVGLIFWSIPVGSIQVWASMDPTQKHWRWATGLANSSEGILVVTFLQKYLPVLALIVLQTALPYALNWLSLGYEGLKARSEVTRVVLRRNFRYQLATLYVTVLCGSLSAHEQLGKIVRHPGELFVILREEVPQVATYFVMYVIARVCIGLPCLLLYPAVHLWRFREVMDKGPPPLSCDFAAEASNVGLVLVLGLTYSVIAPALMPICGAFFGVAFLIYGWLFQNVYTAQFDCAGQCWYELFDGSMVGLVLGTLSLAAVASAFVGFHSGEFVALLVLAVLIVLLYSVMHRHFAVPSRFLSFADACKLDRHCEGLGIACQLVEDYYLDPVVRSGSREQWQCCLGDPEPKDAGHARSKSAPGADPTKDGDLGTGAGAPQGLPKQSEEVSDAPADGRAAGAFRLFGSRLWARLVCRICEFDACGVEPPSCSAKNSTG
mmetsp:Transcript_5778/g.17045  ORF Transcript_5778/g.17045 Transcript_5778/m.17045 type:complete len:870 (+) Transcript_5778:135-2744(+)